MYVYKLILFAGKCDQNIECIDTSDEVGCSFPSIISQTFPSIITQLVIVFLLLHVLQTIAMRQIVFAFQVFLSILRNDVIVYFSAMMVV